MNQPTENPQNQIPVEHLLESLKAQRDKATDELALCMAHLSAAERKNQNLIAILNDPAALEQRIEELNANSGEDDEEDEAPAPKPKPKPKAKPRAEELPAPPSGGSSSQRR